jgi:Leucine-rich repeat (LRR) protein
LVRLDAARNAIEELSALTDLPRLEVVHVERNQIASLEGLSGAALRELYASRNAISSLDGFASASLEVLDLDYNALDTAPELEAFPQLKRLLLRGNELSAFTAPPEHGLELLWLTGNPLDSAVGLSPLRALTNLALGETPLSDLSALTDLTALERLDLHETPVSDLSPLSSHSNIIELELSRTAVRSLDPIEAWTQTARECGALILEGVQLDSPDVAIAFCSSGWRVVGAVDCTGKACGDPI